MDKTEIEKTIEIKRIHFSHHMNRAEKEKKEIAELEKQLKTPDVERLYETGFTTMSDPDYWHRESHPMGAVFQRYSQEWHIAKNINGDWLPDWNNESLVKFAITYDYGCKNYRINRLTVLDDGNGKIIVYKSIQNAEKALSALQHYYPEDWI